MSAAMEPKVRTVEHVDTDGSGVVHFSRWAAFLETAILDRLEGQEVGLTVLEERGLDLRVASLKVRYLAPARYRDRLCLYPEIREVRPASLRIVCGVWSANSSEAPVHLVEGEILIACVRKSDGMPSEIPNDLRIRLEGS